MRLPWSRPLPPWLARLALGLGALLLALLLVEGGLRVYTWAYVTRRLAPLVLPGEGGGLVYVMGDSVPYGFGLEPGAAWPARLGEVLARRSGPRTEVYNASEPGAGLSGVRDRQLGALSQVRAGVPLVAIFQVGHNDRTSLMFNGRASEESDAEIAPIWSEMKLLRLYRSIEERRRRWAPPERINDQGRAQFSTDLGRLCQAFQARGGTCILATYPLCGTAGPEMPETVAMGYNRTRAAQLTVNQLIRWSGQRLGLHVIDLAEDVPLSPSFSTDECLDAVHPTATVHARIAEVVADALEGWGG